MDLIRTKFRQSTDYTYPMLVRDLIQYSLELETILKDNESRLSDLESGYSSLDTRTDALEALTATHTAQIASLLSADIALDARLDVLEALNIATRLTALEGRATTLEANYETGTWVPDLQFGNAKVGITYAATAYARTGRYARYGKLCIAGFGIQLSNKGTSVGVARIHGLPAAFNGIGVPSTGANPAHGWISYAGSFTNTAGYFGLSCMGWDLPNALTLYQTDDASGANMDNTNFGNGTLLVGGCIFVQA